MECQICGNLASPMTLAGGQCAVLCIECQQRFDAFCRLSPTFDNLRRANWHAAALAITKSPGSYPDGVERLEKALKDEGLWKAAMADEALRWIAEEREKHEAASDKTSAGAV